MNRLKLRKPNKLILANVKTANTSSVVWIRDYTGDKPEKYV